MLLARTFNVLCLVLVVQVNNQGHEAEGYKDDEDEGPYYERPVGPHVLALRGDANGGQSRGGGTLHVGILSGAILGLLNHTDDGHLGHVHRVLEHVHPWVVENEAEGGDRLACVNGGLKGQELTVVEIRIGIQDGVLQVLWIRTGCRIYLEEDR